MAFLKANSKRLFWTHPLCLGEACLAALATLWLLIRVTDYYFADSELMCFIRSYWWPPFLVSLVYGLCRCWPKGHVELQIPGSDSSIEITFGDIFKGAGVVVIPVNEYFDGLLGDHVSERSLHGQFIRNILDGQSNVFNSLVDEALTSIEPEEYVIRESGNTDRYPIGTVAKVDVNDKRYLLAALSRTNIETLKASATASELWDCLEGIWESARNYSNGNLIKVPLIGSGLSGVGLTANILIGIILTSFFYHTKRGKIADKIILMLPYGLKGNIDLTTIERNWR